MGLAMASIREFLGQVDLFGDASEEALDWLGGHLSEVRFEPGDMVFAQGDKGAAVGILLTGKLRVRTRSHTGSPVDVGAIYPREFFGEMACIDPGPRTASVSAAASSTVLFMSYSVLNEINELYPELGVAIRRQILRIGAARLREVDARTELVIERGSSLDGANFPSSETEQLRAIEMLRSFNEVELQALYRVARPMHYQTGHVLASQGDSADACYLVLSGAISVLRNLSGVERRLSTLRAGSTVGIVGLVDGAVRSSSLVVEEPSAIMTFQRADFQRLLAAKSNFAMHFQIEMACAIVRQLRSANQRLTTLQSS
jgi:CRP-like cAMP-binding protein